jgi:tricorn protease
VNGALPRQHIYRDGPADKEWLGLARGDYVLAINGQELKAGDNYWRLLSTTLNEYIPVRWRRRRGEDARTVRIASVTSSATSSTRSGSPTTATVEKDERRDRVRAHPLHEPALAGALPAGDRPVLEQAKGIIVDIRFNGGGNIDQELIDILERRRTSSGTTATAPHVGGGVRDRRSPAPRS